MENSKNLEKEETLEENDGYVENIEYQQNVDSNSEQSKTNDSDSTTVEQEEFKKPTLLIGPRCGKPGKLRLVSSTTGKIIKETSEKSDNQLELPEGSIQQFNPEDETPKEVLLQRVDSSKEIPLPYKEPPWTGTPEAKYKLEVLKSGVILDTIDLSERSYYVVGRLLTCHIPMAHPTISRYHAVFQYRSVGDDKNPKGLYLYDLGSTHGTFWNGNRVRPNVYVRLRGGHIIRFGGSQRKYIVQAPMEDQEEESELSVTELKEKRRLELEERERLEEERKLLEEEEIRLRKEKEENEGIDWGMGEDADEESDLTENPFASTCEEELFLDDPKKTLRGWFEREGYDLQYQAEEKGFGQFLCWVELPIENIVGHSVRAEALVKGKKKESVIQCALEACRILDRHGLLRQANHEARKRKSRNWEEEDFYDSDEDNFLDRTGSIEKKREQRMRMAGKLETKVETYNSLLEKYQQVVKKITNLENNLKKSEKSENMQKGETDEDALDAFMSSLNSSVLSKDSIRKMKLELLQLHKEEANLLKLVNLTRPANLPPLIPQSQAVKKKEMKDGSNKAPMIGQRKKFKALTKKIESQVSKDVNDISTRCDIEDQEEEEEEDDDNDEEEEEDEPEKEEKEVERSTRDAKKASTKEIENKIHSEEKEKKKKIPTINDVEVGENVSCRIEGDANSEGNQEQCVIESKRKKRVRNREKHKLEKQNNESENYDENYSTWVPPQNQTGDGRTNLNEKYGY